MKKFIMENDFWSLFPNARIGVVICQGIDNSIKDEDKYKNMICNSEKEALKYLSNTEFSSNEVIKVWREAFKKFKTKKGARSSIEALLKRVNNGNNLGTINVGNEEFIPLGTDENSPPYEGEVVYKDDKGAICRCFNWREAVRTMLTENTKNALLCIELIDERRAEEFENALKDLSKVVQDSLGGLSKVLILDINNKEVTIE
jgi:DNA/RNA-binding domain of Phe-tRNA-synthetase-like protein